MATPIIELENVSKQYDDQFAVNNLSLSIPKGEIFGLLGPNGAGKTTTILMMLGLSEPTSGKIRVSGIDSIRRPIEVKRIVGYLPDNLGFYQNMTGLENLLYTAELNNIPKQTARERADYLLEKVNLTESASKKTGKYSRGMKQRLGLADVLMKNPDVVILDEPTLGIDPEGVRELLKMIRKLSEEEGITVLLSSHHLHQVQQICDRVGIFVKGKLLADGNIESLANQLFKEQSFVIHVNASPIDETLIQEIKEIPHVKEAVKTKSGLDVYCKEDVSPAISRSIIDSGASLYQISNKDFGLDEIYHRYFEGREQT
ncbi:ABC transporter ATP-binding protein [Oceanobacillus halophilus]|uniref:ABC transporter ATP-binding protein n=1 Tax=Oceanobacillus halophilus TaxID=930130 RepID=A0A495A8L3_9BACI|nr:ABC transporter ATP-binding protein [Oceanobacillus halophilus]RKQ35701.1 ABC transporter ATP-binding protein [Oceanobacillus halophilus]